MKFQYQVHSLFYGKKLYSFHFIFPWNKKCIARLIKTNWIQIKVKRIILIIQFY